MKTLTDTPEIIPWFRQPWLWFVLSVPITSVVLSSIMVTVAIVGRDTLVSDNYYKDGMGINQTIEQDQLADELNLAPSIKIEGRDIFLKLRNENTSDDLAQQPFLTFKLIHPTVGDKDITTRLLPTPNGTFIGELPHTLSGRYYLDLYAYDESWRIREEVHLPMLAFKLNQAPAPQ
jgi:hypothetical protein